MPLAIPPELKKINPFVRRAEELDRDKANPESRLVAYYCRQYAVHTGIPLASSSPAAKTCLGHLLEDLEKEKQAMDNFTRDEAAFLCRKFAMKIFDKADLEDRTGEATKNTAKTFYAAASFLQILEQFEKEGSEESTEDRKRIVYAKWKATEILKALKEGRTPTPGGYGEEEIDLEGEEDGDEKLEDEKPPTAPTVETATDEDDDKAEEGVTFDLPLAPASPSQPAAPPSDENDVENEGGKADDSSDELPEEGQEVEFGPPPAYPGPGSDNSAPSTAHYDKPKLSFDLPPPVETRPVPAPAPKKSGGLFGFGKKKEKASKVQIADAVELTRFALAALEDRDADLAAERLQQALSALGR